MIPWKIMATTEYAINPNDTVETTTAHHLSKSELAESYTLYIIGNGLNRYWLPFMVIVGLFGNTLSLIVMLLSHNRTFTTCLYLAALAVSDNILLILGGHFWVATVVKGRFYTFPSFYSFSIQLVGSKLHAMILCCYCCPWHTSPLTSVL